MDRLLLRSTRGLMPTEAGHAFYERAKRAIVIDQAVELVFRHKLIERGLRFHAVGQVDRNERSRKARVVPLTCQPHYAVPVCVQPLCDGPADAFAGTGYKKST